MSVNGMQIAQRLDEIGVEDVSADEQAWLEMIRDGVEALAALVADDDPVKGALEALLEGEPDDDDPAEAEAAWLVELARGVNDLFAAGVTLEDQRATLAAASLSSTLVLLP